MMECLARPSSKHHKNHNNRHYDNHGANVPQDTAIRQLSSVLQSSGSPADQNGTQNGGYVSHRNQGTEYHQNGHQHSMGYDGADSVYNTVAYNGGRNMTNGYSSSGEHYRTGSSVVNVVINGRSANDGGNYNHDVNYNHEMTNGNYYSDINGGDMNGHLKGQGHHHGDRNGGIPNGHNGIHLNHHGHHQNQKKANGNVSNGYHHRQEMTTLNGYMRDVMLDSDRSHQQDNRVPGYPVHGGSNNNNNAQLLQQSVHPQVANLTDSLQLPPHTSLGRGPIDTNTLLAHHQNGYTRRLNDTCLVYQDGSLVSGTLEALIQHLVPTESYYPDRTYIFAFLLSSRLYIPPHKLLNQVCELCKKQQNLQSTETTREKLGMFGPYLIQFFSEWTELFPYDFRDDRLMMQLKEMTSLILCLYPELRKEVGLVMLNVTSKLSGLIRYEGLLVRINQEANQRLKNIVPITDIIEICPTPLVLAQQLTHIDLERLSMIGAEEFVHAFEKDSGKEQSSDINRGSNLESYISWFNRLSYFVATEICMHLKKKNRVRMIEYFVDVAKECVNIGNFNSLMAVIAGMNMSSIARLKKTWGKTNRDKLDILERQMNPSSNFYNYRSSLKAALWRAHSALEERERIVIPFFTVFVKDIFFMNQCCASKTSNGHLNFDKFWQLAKQITDFITWKQVECPFDKHPTVLNYILTNPVFTENSLSLASFECEPPENTYEKNRYKTLKEQMEKIKEAT